MAVQSRKKVFIGKVVSSKMKKTVAVTVERRYKHPLYGKYVKRSSKFLVHDEKNVSTIGDTVRIVETRPISRRKCWRLVEVIEKAR